MKRHIKANVTPLRKRRIMASAFTEESDFNDVLDYCLDHDYEVESEDSLLEYVKHCLDNYNIGDAIEVLTAIYESPDFVDYYRYDFSGLYAPKPIEDVQDLLAIIDEFE